MKRDPRSRRCYREVTHSYIAKKTSFFTAKGNRHVVGRAVSDLFKLSALRRRYKKAYGGAHDNFAERVNDVLKNYT